jgi:multisubunit Na+/H+ antiporter MnhG subunit
MQSDKQRHPGIHATVKQARDTGLALALLCLLAAWLAGFWELTGLALLVLLLSLVFPNIFRPLAGPWFALSRVMGEVSSRVVLTLLFFLVVTPVGLLRRLTGADPMQLQKWRQGNASVMRCRDHLYRPEDLDKPY